jgi:hypothetical protein
MTTSLWLELEFEHTTRVFELAPEDDRAIVVGSLLRADVRVDRLGVKPVHFQFERVGNDLLLKPVYGSDVRISGTLVSEPHALLGSSLLEFAGARMRVRVLSRLPPLTRDETVLDGSAAASDWASHEAATAVVPPPPVRTADPMITVQRPEDEETEVTEIIPPPATRRPEPPRPLLEPEQRTAPAPSAQRTGHHTRATAMPPKSEPPATHHGRRWRSVATVAAAALLVLFALVAIAGIIRMCAVTAPEG